MFTSFDISRGRRAFGPLAGVVAAALVLTGGLVPRPAAALTDEEVYRVADFSDQAPSARALGLGGAFIAVADDPSAIFWNPAGLSYADRPQVLFDVRGTDRDDIEATIPGVYTTSTGLNPTGFGPATGSILIEDEDVVSAGFQGYVHPVNEWFVIGFARHERVNIERDSFTAFETSSIAVDGAAGTVFQPNSTFGELDVLMDTWSVGLSFAPHDVLAIGLTLSLARLDVVATHDNFWFTTLDTDADVAQDVFLKVVDYRTLIDDDDTTFTFNFGLLWQPHDWFRVGLVYRDGPEFEVEQRILADGVRAALLRDAFSSVDPTGLGRIVNTFNFPDSYGIGLAFGPFFEPSRGGGLTISLDAVHVEYGDLLEGFVQGLNNQLFGQGTPAVGIEDETELHLGFGYSWTVGYNNSVHLRAGLYTAGDGSIVRAPIAVATNGGGTQPAGEFFPRDFDGDAEVHFTVGAGFTLRRGFYSFELDAVADISDEGNEYLGTALFRF